MEHVIQASPLRIAGLGSLLLLAGLLGGAAGALVAVRVDDEPPAVPDSESPASATPDASERLRESIPRAMDSIVTVQVEGGVVAGGFGTGIVLSSDGLILTANHVVAGATRVTIVLPSGEEREATVLADDSPFQDVALLQTAGQGLRVARLGDSGAARIGDPVAVIASVVAGPPLLRRWRAARRPR